jgi:uncharacterized membrane protein YkvA (DUF1232 family)
MPNEKDEKIIDVEFVAEDEQIKEKRLKFYEKLREKITGFANAKTGEKGGKFAEYILALPDFFILLYRLTVDKRINTTQKLLVGGIIAYVISPIDIIPDFIPIIGYVDDLVLVVFGLNIILNDLDNQILLDNWSGQQNVLELMQKVTSTAEKFLDKNILKKINHALRKMGSKS